MKYSDVAEGEKVKEDCCPGKPFVTFRTEVKCHAFSDHFYKSTNLLLIMLPPPLQRSGRTYCFWYGSRLHLLRIFVSALSYEPLDGFLPNLHRYFIGTIKRTD